MIVFLYWRKLAHPTKNRRTQPYQGPAARNQERHVLREWSLEAVRWHNQKSNQSRAGSIISGDTFPLVSISCNKGRCPIATMLLLDYQNVLIQSLLTERFSGSEPRSYVLLELVAKIIVVLHQFPLTR